MKTARQLANEIMADLLDKNLVSVETDEARNQAIDLIETCVSDFAENVADKEYQNGLIHGMYPDLSEFKTVG